MNDTIESLRAERDAEIARLKAALGEQSLQTARLLTDVDQLADDLAAHKRALLAGPAALRALRSDDYSPGYVAGVVERAQAAAMKEKP